MGCCGKVVKGAAGIAKATLRVGRVSEDVIQFRRDVCRACDKSSKRKRKDGTMGLTSLSICGACDCLIKAKTTLAEESCPDGKWLQKTQEDVKR